MRNKQSQGSTESRPTTDRLPPHSAEAEKGVLGCVMLSPQDCMGECIVQLKQGAASFYCPEHQVIYTRMLDLYHAGTVIDSITLYERMKSAGDTEQIEDLLFIITSLADATPSAASLEFYLSIVREKFTLRRMVQAYTEGSARVFEGDGTVDELLAEMDRLSTSFNEDRTERAERSAHDVVEGVMQNRIEKFRRGHKFRIGPATGFNYLDNILPGLGAGQLIVIAARPATGKSALIMQIAENIAEREKVPVAIFSLEMTDESLMLRAIFQRAGADITKFTNGFLADSEVAQITRAAGDIAALPLFIDEQPRMSIEELEVKARRMRRQRKIGVIFVDYFQLMYVRHTRRQSSRSEELAEVSMRLKALAKELQIPVVVCAQMNREIEKETHRRPKLSDLRDTGQLEQDADVVMFLWKPDVSSERWENALRNIFHRLQKVPPGWLVMDGANDEGKNWKYYLSIVYCTVEKQREGRSGADATMVFLKPWTRFVDAYRPPKEKSAEAPSTNGQAPTEEQQEAEL